MPALGESVTEGTVTRWLKAEGDTVEVDEPLLEVSTDKVDTEVPSPVAGSVQKILVGEDETVPVGADLAIVGDGASGGGAAATQAADRRRAAAEPTPAPTAAPTPSRLGAAAGAEHRGRAAAETAGRRARGGARSCSLSRPRGGARRPSPPRLRRPARTSPAPAAAPASAPAAAPAPSRVTTAA